MALDFDKEILKIIKNKNIDELERHRLFKIREEEDSIIVKEMLNHGYEIDSVYDFVNSKESYIHAIEPLLQILEKRLVKDDVIIEGIVRALTRKFSKGKVEKQLLKEYKTLADKKRQGILGGVFGNAIEYLYSDEYFFDIVEIVKNVKNGRSRQMFVLALGKTKKYKKIAENLLLDLTFDNDVRLHAIEALTKLKPNSSKINKRMEVLSQSPDKIISKKSKLFLKK